MELVGYSCSFGTMGRRKVFGPIVVVTETFRKDLRAWLDAHAADGSRRSMRQLALAIGCNPSMVWQLLNTPDEVKTSTLIVPIVQHTGIPMPAETAQDQDAEMLAQLRRLRVEHPVTFEAVMALVVARLSDK